ncbi:MAG: hypothetical protein Q9166_007260 [cf. Caloplaca sp. 2 TL-2023]
MVLSTMLMVLQYMAVRVASLPLDDRALSPNPNTNLSFSPEPTPLNDWEHFAYPIPRTTQILKGRIFTDNPLRASSLHFTLDGALVIAQQQLSHLGPDARLWSRDNPFTYRVPGCYFGIGSKVQGERPVMTWKMMRDVVMALQQVLEQQQRYFHASFVLTDTDQVTWGHGEVADRGPLSQIL